MEIYLGNYVDAVVFHHIPLCQGKCNGCYLKPHAQRWSECNNKVKKMWQWSLALNSICTEKSMKARETVICVQEGEGYLTGIMEFLDSRDLKDKKIQILTTHNVWKNWDKYKENNYTAARQDKRLKNNIIRAVSLDEYKFDLRDPSIWNSLEEYDIINILWSKVWKSKFLQDRLIDFAEKTNKITHLVAPKDVITWSNYNDNYNPSPATLHIIYDLVSFYNNKARDLNNIRLDYCIRHAMGSDCNIPCRAGINMFNIHTHGGITGCPYSNIIAAYMEKYKDIKHAINTIRRTINIDPALSEYNACTFRKLGTLL